jgi:hypothetical protein
MKRGWACFEGGGGVNNIGIGPVTMWACVGQNWPTRSIGGPITHNPLALNLAS